ncbi:metallophosphoesterase family protein [Erythrobacter sp. R86502]|uniref:metallophosphoesterase family protein n=1 Tax=Erythrobacter sp. R86502 TaxID=3093846 RepID=UPI0036D29076
MLQRLRDFFKPSPPPKLPAVPPGTRYYAIGDIHGRLDLYEALIGAIETEIAQAPEYDHHVIVLGDLVDRGPDSAGVVERTRIWQQTGNVQVLAGNHEEMFLTAFTKPEALRHFLKHGGTETVLSYGLSRKQLATMDLDEIFARLPEIVPQSVRDYIAGFETMVRTGDYVFVHAGVDPARTLADQQRSDLLWIRERFLNHVGPLEKVVVHGHTIFETVMDCGNRIGIDTGAFRSGVLTALVLEGDRRRVLQARAAQGESPAVFHGDRPH